MANEAPFTESRDTEGDTIHENGTVGTSAVNLPASAAGVISEFTLECMETNSKTQTLSVSMDGGTKFKTLQPGDQLTWSPKGNLTQIKIKGGAAATEYETIINREPG